MPGLFAGVLLVTGLALSAHLAIMRNGAAAVPNSTAAEVAELRHRVDELTRRLAEHESASAHGSALASKVVAPFEVVDKTGKTVLLVRADPNPVLSLHTKGGKDVVFLSALPSGGFVKALSPDHTIESVLGVNGKFTAVALRLHGTPRATLAITAVGKPHLEMTNDNGTNIVALTQGTAGGGYLQLGDASGQAMVEAGITDAGFGVVRAGPTFKCVGVGGLRVTDCIMGYKQ